MKFLVLKQPQGERVSRCIGTGEGLLKPGHFSSDPSSGLLRQPPSPLGEGFQVVVGWLDRGQLRPLPTGLDALKRGPHHATLGSDGGAVDDRSLGAGDKGHDGRDFSGFLEAL